MRAPAGEADNGLQDAILQLVGGPVAQRYGQVD